MIQILTVAPEPALATVAAAAILFFKECVKALARLFVTKAFSSNTLNKLHNKINDIQVDEGSFT